MKNRITGRSAFLALLKDEGITHLFGIQAAGREAD
jgi:benzoylformate decarboxylase